MGMLNRSAVVIRPLQPYLDWAKQDDTTDIAERVFDDLRTAPHVYLLRIMKTPSRNVRFWTTSGRSCSRRC